MQIGSAIIELEKRVPGTWNADKNTSDLISFYRNFFFIVKNWISEVLNMDLFRYQAKY